MKILIGLFFFFVGFMLNAQPGPSGPPPPNPVPLSGIEILIGGGAILGARKLLRSRKS